MGHPREGLTIRGERGERARGRLPPTLLVDLPAADDGASGPDGLDDAWADALAFLGVELRLDRAAALPAFRRDDLAAIGVSHATPP
ncbi:MAG TPA: hypothetical protein VHB21_18990 [Minicystis sp.]|nr:hypothetical protein [Minicystis sp.]